MRMEKLFQKHGRKKFTIERGPGSRGWNSPGKCKGVHCPRGIPAQDQVAHWIPHFNNIVLDHPGGHGGQRQGKHVIQHLLHLHHDFVCRRNVFVPWNFTDLDVGPVPDRSVVVGIWKWHSWLDWSDRQPERRRQLECRVAVDGQQHVRVVVHPPSAVVYGVDARQ